MTGPIQGMGVLSGEIRTSTNTRDAPAGGGVTYLFKNVPFILDRLLEALTEDLEALTQRVRKSRVPFTSSMSEDDQRFVERALLRAEDTYGHLLRAVDEALRVREVILG